MPGPFDDLRKAVRNDPERDARVDQLKQEFDEFRGKLEFSKPINVPPDLPRPGRRAKKREEKAEVIFAILAVWMQNEDMRLSQLIANVFRTDDPESWSYFYNTEDYELVQALEGYYSSSQ